MRAPANRSLRITFVCPSDNRAGGMRVIAIYAGRLARRGHQVTVVMPRAEGPSFRDRARALVKQRVWLRKDRNERSYFHEIPVAARWSNHAGPIIDADVPDADVVIATWWETAEWVWRLSASKGRKLHFMQDYETWGAPNGDISRVDAASALPIPKIVIASWVSDLLEQRWQQKPVALIANSVDTGMFHAPLRAKNVRPVVGFTYSTLYNKGTDISMAAIGIVRQAFPDLHVVAFGQRRPYERTPLPPNTEFHLNVPDDQLRQIYSACDAWLFGTRIEGFGLPILEAMACRTPVVGTPAGAAPQLISQGGGILVAKEDPDDMARAVLKVAEMSDQEWRRMSDHAFQTATSYTWDDATDQFEGAIRSVVDPGHLPERRSVA